MIIVLKPDATEKEIEHVMDRVRELGLSPHLSKGQERTIIGVIGDDRLLANHPLRAIPGVEEVVPILAPWKLAGREFKKDDTIIEVSGGKIGARNMQNFELLKEVGAYDKPVLLKRGLSATIKEWLLSAEYIMSRGNKNVMLCERGIRTFEAQYRNTLDLSAVPALKALSHLPVIVDPSHATGKWELVAPMAKAAIAAGADGLLIEVHSNPECALCDGEESLKPAKFKELMKDLKKIAEAVDREI